jgi:hypothetical protein
MRRPVQYWSIRNDPPESADQRQDQHQQDGTDESGQEYHPSSRRLQDDLATSRFFGGVWSGLGWAFAHHGYDIQ